MRRIMMLAFVLVAVLAAAACTRQEPEVSLEEQVPAEVRERMENEGADGGGGDGAAAGEEVVFVAENVSFQAPTELPSGPVTLTLENKDNLPHDITIEELGDETVVEVSGGETKSGTVELEPGTYTIYCSVPGHRATMEETVEVS